MFDNTSRGHRTATLGAVIFGILAFGGITAYLLPPDRRTDPAVAQSRANAAGVIGLACALGFIGCAVAIVPRHRKANAYL